MAVIQHRPIQKHLGNLTTFQYKEPTSWHFMKCQKCTQRGKSACFCQAHFCYVFIHAGIHKHAGLLLNLLCNRERKQSPKKTIQTHIHPTCVSKYMSWSATYVILSFSPCKVWEMWNKLSLKGKKVIVFYTIIPAGITFFLKNAVRKIL